MLSHPVLDALKRSGRMSDDDLAFLAQYGRDFEPTSLPRGIKLREPGRCFDVARELARAGWGAYARGFGLHPEHPEPLAHGWISKYGAAIDASWPQSERASYWGSANPKHLDRLRAMSTPFLARSMFYKPSMWV